MRTAKSKKLIMSLIVLLVAGMVFIWLYSDYLAANYSQASNNLAYFRDDFDQEYRLEEAGNEAESESDDWWLNSGAWFISHKGVGKTLHGNLSMRDEWYSLYRASNPQDTTRGQKPQNVFRLIQRDFWLDLSQRCYFKINQINLTKSSNRNESNGILLFNRYVDGDNLYYAGLRVDGAAVIKKKMDGKYYTLAYVPYYNSDLDERVKKSRFNFLPTDKWLGLKSVVKTNSDKSVSIKLYIDEDSTGEWKLIAEARDDGSSFGQGVINQAGHAGIRTDFMDLEMDKYWIMGTVN